MELENRIIRLWTVWERRNPPHPIQLIPLQTNYREDFSCYRAVLG